MRNSQIKLYVICVLIFIGAILRYQGILDQDMWADEVVTVQFSES